MYMGRSICNSKCILKKLNEFYIITQIFGGNVNFQNFGNCGFLIAFWFPRYFLLKMPKGSPQKKNCEKAFFPIEYDSLIPKTEFTSL